MCEGGYVTRRSQYDQVDSANLWNLPQRSVPIAAAFSSPQSCERFAPLADHMIAGEPDPEPGRAWDAARPGKRPGHRIGQLPWCFGADRQATVARVHEQFRWFGGASRHVRPQDVAEHMCCGSDVDAHVAAARPFVEVGFTRLALPQIGGAPQHQEPFFEFARNVLRPALRAEFGSGS